MKKLLGIMVIALMGLGFMACSTTSETITLSSEQSLASMAYLSGNMLKFNATEETNLAFNLSEETIEVEDELETVNEYLEMLKAFMENGATGFGSISEQASDRAEFEFMLTIVVAEQEYKLYYNVDPSNSEISGIFIIDGEEYTITAYNDLDDSDDFEDDDEFEDEDEDEYENEDEFENEEDDEEDLSFTNLSAVTTESTSEATTTIESSTTENNTNVIETTENNSVNEEKEHKMVLIARNGENYVEMTYKVETENKETETKFEMESYINGVEKEVSIEIKIENKEYKIEIEDGDNSYEFKREVEGNGIEYKLEYEVNGVEGEIKILETENELGEKVYIYEIEEEGKYKEVEIDDDDDFEDEEEDETEDLVSLM
jgi:hypothetical protein